MKKIEQHKEKLSLIFVYLGTFGICFIALCAFLIFIPYMFFGQQDNKPPVHTYIMLALAAVECVTLILLGLWSNMSFKKNRKLKSYFQMSSGAIIFAFTFIAVCYWISLISRSNFEINASYFLQAHILVYIFIILFGLAESIAVFGRGLYHAVFEKKSAADKESEESNNQL